MNTWLYLTNENQIADFNIEQDYQYIGDFTNPMNFQPCAMFSAKNNQQVLIIPMVLSK